MADRFGAEHTGKSLKMPGRLARFSEGFTGPLKRALKKEGLIGCGVIGAAGTLAMLLTTPVSVPVAALMGVSVVASGVFGVAALSGIGHALLPPPIAPMAARKALPPPLAPDRPGVVLAQHFTGAGEQQTPTQTPSGPKGPEPKR